MHAIRTPFRPVPGSVSRRRSGGRDGRTLRQRFGSVRALARRWSVPRGAVKRPTRFAVTAALAGALTVSLAPLALADEPVSVAVFDFELIDTSLEGELNGLRDDETARLDRLGDMLREAYARHPDYRLVSVDPVRDIARSRRLQNCGGCDRRFASSLGAERSVTGTVQKVSNLILNINIYLRDTDGTLSVAHSADIRSNTDQSWQRGLEWLMRNRLGLDPEKAE